MTMGGPEQLPNLIIAGVSKGGTTSLFRYLAQHPDICPSPIKELRYFEPLRYGEPLTPIESCARHFEHCTGQRAPDGGNAQLLRRRASRRDRDARQPGRRRACPRVLAGTRPTLLVLVPVRPGPGAHPQGDGLREVSRHLRGTPLRRIGRTTGEPALFRAAGRLLRRVAGGVAGAVRRTTAHPVLRRPGR